MPKMICKRCGMPDDNLEVDEEGEAWHTQPYECVVLLRSELKAWDSRILHLIQERDNYRRIAEQRWAMRREFEEILGLEDRGTYDEVLFNQGLDTLRRWKAIAERAASTGTYAGNMERMGDT
jgi:hypothetical protein